MEKKYTKNEGSETMKNLKQKIEQKAKALRELIIQVCGRDICVGCPISTHHNCDNELVKAKDVVALLDEATRQIQEIMERVRAEATQYRLSSSETLRRRFWLFWKEKRNYDNKMSLSKL